MSSSSGILSLSPGDFEGNDGSWSTFSLFVGDQSQPFRVLPSMKDPQIWLPDLSLICNASDSTWNCPGQRSIPNTTLPDDAGWQRVNSFDLLTLFNQSNATLGLDYVRLSNSSNQSDVGPDEKMPIAAYTSTDYWLGLLGLGDNFTSLGDQNDMKSPLRVMKDAGAIGSLSFGYTAGSSYNSPQEPGSLTLGGYNAVRVESDGISPTIDPSTRDLQLRLSDLSISNGPLGGSSSLLRPAGADILASLDSSTGQLWMPPDVCQAFADALDLTYISYWNMYLMNDTLRQDMSDLNTTLSFTIGDSVGSGASITVVVPFAAFDFAFGKPRFDNAVSYFPLRNATPTSGNIIGRMFLQEAYVVVDWERDAFNVSRVRHAVNSSHLVPIPPVSTDLTPSPSPDASNSKPLTGGQIASIVISCLILVCAVSAPAWWLRRRRRQTRDRKASINAPTIGTVDTVGSGWDKPELMASESKVGRLLELDFLREQEADSTQLLEMSGSGVERELMSNEVLEMEGDLVQPDVKDRVDGDDDKKGDAGDEAKDDAEKEPQSVHELEGDTLTPEKPLAE